MTKDQLASRNARLDRAEDTLNRAMKELSAREGHRHLGNALMNATMHTIGTRRSKRQVELTKRIRHAMANTLFIID